MSFKRETLLRMDLGGLPQREQRREVKKQEQQAQQVAESAEALRRGFESAYAEQRRKIRLRELAESDPSLYFFLVKNRSIESA